MRKKLKDIKHSFNFRVLSANSAGIICEQLLSKNLAVSLISSNRMVILTITPLIIFKQHIEWYIFQLKQLSVYYYLRELIVQLLKLKSLKDSSMIRIFIKQSHAVTQMFFLSWFPPFFLESSVSLSITIVNKII